MLVCHDQTRVRARHEIPVTDSPRKGSKQVGSSLIFRIFAFPLIICCVMTLRFHFGFLFVWL